MPKDGLLLFAVTVVVCYLMLLLLWPWPLSLESQWLVRFNSLDESSAEKNCC